MMNQEVTIKLDETRVRAFSEAISALAKFRQAFGRDLQPEFIAEIYVAMEFGLDVVGSINAPGYDAISKMGERYQIKLRNAQNVDLRNFDFDFLVLVNLHQESYQLIGMWRLSVEQAKAIFTWRGDKYQKYQATQDKIKAISERVR